MAEGGILGAEASGDVGPGVKLGRHVVVVVSRENKNLVWLFSVVCHLETV